MRRKIFALVVAAIALGAVFGCSKPMPPVTETHIAGMPLDTKSAVLSRLNTPVAADAVVQVPGKHDQIIVNVFPADENGTAKAGAKPEVIMAADTDHFKLSKSMSGKKLAPGTYLMNIVYGGQTERVLFAVK